MQKITTFLTFESQAEEAVDYYLSVFKDSSLVSKSYYPKEVPHLGGKMMSATFKLYGQQYYALNGGSYFKFSDGMSLFVHCETQEEVDFYWDKLSAGGEPKQCGWLKDQFGASWQIIPSILGKLLGDPDPQKSRNVMNAMMQMKKIDIEKLKQAHQNL